MTDAGPAATIPTVPRGPGRTVTWIGRAAEDRAAPASSRRSRAAAPPATSTSARSRRPPACAPTVRWSPSTPRRRPRTAARAGDPPTMLLGAGDGERAVQAVSRIEATQFVGHRAGPGASRQAHQAPPTLWTPRTPVRRCGRPVAGGRRRCRRAGEARFSAGRGRCAAGGHRPRPESAEPPGAVDGGDVAADLVVEQVDGAYGFDEQGALVLSRS
jgi:hypothetical protein